MKRFMRVLRENPPTVGEAAITFVVGLLWWAKTELPTWVPEYVAWSGLVLFSVVAIFVIGKITQKFTVPKTPSE